VRPRFRRTGSRDGNHQEIVRALEAAGRTVLDLHELGLTSSHRKGAPDILVGWGRAHQLLMEIKNPDGFNRVDEAQLAWHAWWRGTPVVIVRTAAEALAATGVK
jgi:hypothetical protein